MDGASALVVAFLVLFVLGALIVDYRQELIAAEVESRRLRDQLQAAMLLVPMLLDGSDAQAVEYARRWLAVAKRRENVEGPR